MLFIASLRIRAQSQQSCGRWLFHIAPSQHPSLNKRKIDRQTIPLPADVLVAAIKTNGTETVSTLQRIRFGGDTSNRGASLRGGRQHPCIPLPAAIRQPLFSQQSYSLVQMLNHSNTTWSSQLLQSPSPRSMAWIELRPA